MTFSINYMTVKLIFFLIYVIDGYKQTTSSNLILKLGLKKGEREEGAVFFFK